MPIPLIFFSMASSQAWPGGEWQPHLAFVAQTDPAPHGLGDAMALLGDVDGDGFHDLALGAAFAGEFGQVSGAVFVACGRSGRTLRHIDGGDDHLFGRALLGGVDLDGDGRQDLLVGAPGWSGFMGPPGSVSAFDAASGRLLYRLEGTSGELFGSALVWLDDLDGDSVKDYAVGAPYAQDWRTYRSGQISVHSGRTGMVIWKVSSPATNEMLGGTIAAIGDVDGDGRKDLVAGIPHSARFPTAAALVLDAMTGAVLRVDGAPTSVPTAGEQVASAGDLDYDRIEDCLASNADLIYGDRVVAYSGATGTVLWISSHSDPYAQYGCSVAPWDDLDDDGVQELIVGAPRPLALGGSRTRGEFCVLSGGDGTILTIVSSGATGGAFAHGVLNAGDLDGDGRVDLLVSHGLRAIYVQADEFGVESWNLIPGLSPALQYASASAGGGPEWRLDFPASRAGARFGVLLSASGTGPSAFGGALIPLTRDAWFRRSVAGWDAQRRLHGRLDACGDAELTLRISASALRPLIGRSFHACAVVGDAPSYAVEAYSRAVEVRVGP